MRIVAVFTPDGPQRTGLTVADATCIAAGLASHSHG